MASFMTESEHLKIQLEEIKKATNSFGNKVIGSGGFGAVYKGEVSHSQGRTIVAIKRLNRTFGQGEREFLKEILMLSRYRHHNLVSLLGYCDEADEKILVYEYASNGSLDQHLRDPGVTWTQRLKICIGAAKGLSYLHDPKGTHQRLLHCDIKSANILLDENWNAKVADFGLARTGPANQENTVLITNVRGTIGYCDPLYMETYMLTKESDIYSFGVVLVEVLCGRLCVQRRHGRQFTYYLNDWIKKYKENKLEEIIFQDIRKQMDPSSLKTFSDIAFQCLQDLREDRPEMSLLVKNLQIALESQMLHDHKLTLHPVQYRSFQEGNGVAKTAAEHQVLEDEIEKDMQSISDSDDSYWEQKLPNDYKEIIKWSNDVVKWTTKKELYSILCTGFLTNNSREWFFLDKNGKKCLMLSARTAFVLAIKYATWKSSPELRFGEAYVTDHRYGLRILGIVKSKVLSPQTTYACYLVFKLPQDHSPIEGRMQVRHEDFGDSWYIYLGSPPQIPVDENTHNKLNRPKIKGIPQQRSDGWMEVQVWEFQTVTTIELISIRLNLTKRCDMSFYGLIMQGIELRPR